VDPVQFIAGPGNAYVTEAKKQVFGVVGIDMLAGPSEIMVIADESANPSYVAADLLSQAEHGSGREQAVLVTNSQVLVDVIEGEVAKQRSRLPESQAMDLVIEKSIFVIKVENIQEVVAICNEYAPEHVEILTKSPELIEPLITSAGAIMMGEWTPEPIGDFVAGSSHVLPTGGSARIFSGLNTGHFMKKISVQNFSRKMLEETRSAAEMFAKMESLPAHGRSVSIRFDE
ncbi:MAG: histidinol dehydrogenase, partial [Alphaproteobacteria bacterium]|nr:histidinol dehydrogenase [Alphaproteobacteria bacterium]